MNRLRHLPSPVLAGLALAGLMMGGAGLYWLWQGRGTSASEGLSVTSLKVRDAPLRLVVQRRSFRIDLPLVRLRAAQNRMYLPESPRWNQLVHALRLWGMGPDKPPPPWTGQQMLGVVLDAQRCRQVLGGFPHARNRHGLQFTGDPSRGVGEKHQDETVSVLAEIGVRSTQLVPVLTDQLTVADAIRASAANCFLDQELDFTAVALAHYLPPQSRWRNKVGQTISFDQLCVRLCQGPFGEGTCHGCHSLYALAVLLAADTQYPILSGESRRRACARLADAVQNLAASQRPDGSWGANWFLGKGDSPTMSRTEAALADLVVTGHTLEWLALAPEGVERTPTMITRAAEYLLTRLLEAPPPLLQDDYNAYTHAANALKLWCEGS